MCNVVNSQIIDIPDQHFKANLINHDPVIDLNGDGEIQLSEAETFTGNLDVSGTNSEPGEIQDLTGIEFFVNISSLNCGYNQITNLILDNNSELHTLICNYNKITDLDLSNNIELRTLSTSGNLFESIDLNNNINLEFFQSNFGQLSSLNTDQNPLLRFLYLQGNSLSTLDLSNNLLLVGLIIDNNEIDELDFDNNNFLNFVYCRNNLLSDLDLSNQTELITLDCKDNSFLEYIDLNNGANGNLNISGGSQSCNFENLPTLTLVCLDDVNSALADFISTHVGHQIQFTIDCNLGVSDYRFPKIIIFPNPAHQRLSVISSRPIGQIEVFNLIGQRIILEEIYNNQFQLNVSSLNRGMYIIRFLIEPNTYVIQRFIKN